MTPLADLILAKHAQGVATTASAAWFGIPKGYVKCLATRPLVNADGTPWRPNARIRGQLAAWLDEDDTTIRQVIVASHEENR